MGMVGHLDPPEIGFVSPDWPLGRGAKPPGGVPGRPILNPQSEVRNREIVSVTLSFYHKKMFLDARLLTQKARIPQKSPRRGP